MSKNNYIEVESFICDIENINHQLLMFETALLEGDTLIDNEAVGGALSLLCGNLKHSCTELKRVLTGGVA